MNYKPVEISSYLSQVLKPARYINHELNSFKKKPSEDTVNFCFAFPDVYEVGFSHNGLKILYTIINKQSDATADRVYAPWPDFEIILKHKKIALFAIESGVPVNQYDFLGFTLQSELTFTNILSMLDLAGIPIWANERTEKHPIILAGGPCATNPASISPFFDAIFIGEAEEAIIEIKNAFSRKKKRSEVLQELKKIHGMYVPFFYKKGETVKIRKFNSFHNMILPAQKQLVPWIQTTHDRFVSEVMRGCSRGCRFCHAGFFYRPVRERNKNEIVEQILAEVASSGWREVALTSLSTSDYSCIHEILSELYIHLQKSQTNISLPSLRVDTLSETIIDLLNRMHQTGLTIAPEAGSQRLRDCINKNLSEEDILNGVRIAKKNDWKLIKLYFMIGLPFETKEDIEAIFMLLEKIIGITGKQMQINITVSPFVPKPFTPFQWAKMADREELLSKIIFLKNKVKRFKFVKLKYHTVENQEIEGIISRGKKEVANWIYEAYKKGAKFDGWNEHFNYSFWDEAADKINLDRKSYHQAIPIEDDLPWDFIDIGVDKKFLLQEWEKAQKEDTTPDCRFHCSNCGICDEVTNPVYRQLPKVKVSIPSTTEYLSDNQIQKYYYRIFFSKTGLMSYVGHLDLLRAFQRMLRISNLPIYYSQGFHPKVFINICPPLAVGIHGENEYVDFALTEFMKIKQITEKIKPVFPTYLGFKSMIPFQNKKMLAMECYPAEKIEVILPSSVKSSFFILKTQEFVKQKEFFITRVRKGKSKQIDLKKVINKIQWEDNILTIDKMRVGATIFDVLHYIYDIKREETGSFKITRKKFLAD